METLNQTSKKFIEILKEDYSDRKNACFSLTDNETTVDQAWGGFDAYLAFVMDQPKLAHIINNVQEEHLQIKFAAAIYDNAKSIKNA